MPLYTYEIIMPDGSAGETFEVIQSMSAEELKTHPETGLPVRRVVGVPNAPRSWTDMHAKAATSDSSMERLGFTKYKKAGGGKYEKIFGKGPDSVQKPAE